MNRNVVVGIVGAIIGAVAVIVYQIFFPLPFPLPHTGPCSGGNPHCIVVSVITVDGMPQIQGIADERVHDRGAVIFWEIGTAGYTFPNNGIEFPANKPNHPAPNGEFNCMRMSSTTFKCIDNYNTMGPMGYVVTVQGSGSSATPAPLDPFVVNL